MARIGEILLRHGIISSHQLDVALKRQKNMRPHMPLGEILIDMGLLTYDALLKYLELQQKENR